MKLYADTPVRLLRQIIADVVALLVVAAATAAGVFLDRQLHGLAERTRSVADAASGSSGAITTGAQQLSGVPLVGSSLGGLLDRLGKLTGQTAGTLGAQADRFDLLAPIIGLVVILAGAAPVALIWALTRGRWIRRASAAVSTSDRAGLEVLALGAMLRAGPVAVGSLGPDIVGRWHAGDPAALRALADLERRRLGVRVDQPASPKPTRLE